MQADQDLATLTTVNDVIEQNTKCSKIKMSGRVSFQGSTETIQANGKTLKKLETVVTGFIRLVLWQSDIDRVQNGQTYNLTRAIVKNFQDTKYITLNRQSAIAQTQITIQRNDEQLIDNQLSFHTFPSESAIQLFL